MSTRRRVLATIDHVAGGTPTRGRHHVARPRGDHADDALGQILRDAKGRTWW